ncbi:MAG: hypothetical protein KA715_12150 [Xanthomonadaceae bacterium]|nr:hypothetical protein [Xanthomonadaceae bacterium]
MKKLIVSVKTSKEVLNQATQAMKDMQEGKFKESHYEIAFSEWKDFRKFVKNIDVIIAIYKHKPKSIYELSKIMGIDVSNLNKVISFFEDLELIKIKTSEQNGRTIKTPIVEYGQIQFNLKAA